LHQVVGGHRFFSIGSRSDRAEPPFLRVVNPKRSRCWHTGGDCAMSNNSTTSPALQSEAESAVHLLDDWFGPIEAGLRERVREFIQAMIREAALVRPRYGRRPKADATNGNVFGDADSRQHERAGAESDRRRWQRCVLMKQNHLLHARRRGNISL